MCLIDFFSLLHIKTTKQILTPQESYRGNLCKNRHLVHSKTKNSKNISYKGKCYFDPSCHGTMRGSSFPELRVWRHGWKNPTTLFQSVVQRNKRSCGVSVRTQRFVTMSRWSSVNPSWVRINVPILPLKNDPSSVWVFFSVSYSQSPGLLTMNIISSLSSLHFVFTLTFGI